MRLSGKKRKRCRCSLIGDAMGDKPISQLYSLNVDIFDGF
jgi:hypothetical protein